MLPRRIVAILVAAVAVAGCAAPGRSTSEVSTTQQPRAAKALVVGIQQEPLSFVGTNSVGPFRGGSGHVPPMLHEYLVTENESGTFESRLAADPLSIESGNWRLNPDGTMDTTWKIKPNVKWHDGAPFTSADIAFSFEINKTPEFVGQGSAQAVRLMQSIDAPDPLTAVVHWSSPYVNANEARGLEPLPKHLLEGPYQQADQDTAALVQNPYFTTDFMGTGAYRLSRWEHGAFMELAAFDGNYRGRPPLDRIVIRFINDSNALVAAALTGEIEVVLSGVDMDAAQEVKSRWEGTGNQVQAGTTGNLYQLEIQHRPEYARPTNGFTNLLVRQALYQAIDRESIDRIETGGLAPIADSYYMPQSFMHAQLAPDIPQFPYDPARAQQLLAQAGWTRGGDGVLVDQAGQRFETESRADRAGGAEKAQAVIADSWQALGVRSDQVVLPVAGARDNEYLSTNPGVYLARPSDYQFVTGRLHSRNIAAPANRWAGANRGGYSNPTVDDLLDKVLVTFGEREQVELHRQLLREQMGNVALMPLWWNTEPALLQRGVKGPLLVRNTATWNIFDWDKE